MEHFNILGSFVKNNYININVNNKNMFAIAKSFEMHLEKKNVKKREQKDIKNVVDAVMTISNTRQDFFGVLTKINRDTLYDFLSYVKSNPKKGLKKKTKKRFNITHEQRTLQLGGDGYYDIGMMFFMFIISVITKLFFDMCLNSGEPSLHPRQQRSTYITNNARGFTSEGTDAELDSERRHWYNNSNSYKKKCNPWPLSHDERSRRHESRIRRSSSGRRSLEGRSRSKSAITFEEARRNSRSTNSDNYL